MRRDFMRFKEIGEEIDFFNLSNMSHQEKLARDKALSRNMAEARKRAKRDTCMYCGKQVTSFCSHFYSIVFSPLILTFI